MTTATTAVTTTTDTTNNNSNNNKNSMYRNQSKQILKVRLTILWNQQCEPTELLLTTNRNIIIRDNEKGTRVLIERAIRGDRNVIKKGAEKILKYKDLRIEIQRMWNVKAGVIPVIIGATGTISGSLQTVPEQHNGKARN
jgi:hypothetical protein